MPGHKVSHHCLHIRAPHSDFEAQMIKSAVEQSVSSIKIYLNQQETSPGTLQLSSSQVPAIFVDKRLNRMVWLSGPMLARNLGDKRNAYQILLNSSVLEVGIR